MPDANSPSPTAAAPKPSVKGLLLWLGVVLAGGLLFFSRQYLAELAAGVRVPFSKPLINELTGWLGAGLLFFPLRALVRRFPFTAGRRLARLPIYLAAVVVFSVTHTLMNWGLREICYRLAGYGSYDYGIMPLRFAMEFPGDLLAIVLMSAAIQAADRLRLARARELRTAQLESSLAKAELENLRLQLQPHFLFNALNTISSTMYEDPAAADEMLDRLAELLRASLRTARTDEVLLVDELGVLDAYLAIMRARFGDRLQVERRIEAAAEGALVPSLLLQPLVENAVRHGGAERVGRGRVVVAARRDGAFLDLTVEDDGPVTGSAGGGTCQGGGEGGGLGLKATAERLELLYGPRHLFAAGPGPQGGFRVHIRLPWRRLGEAAA